MSKVKINNAEVQRLVLGSEVEGFLTELAEQGADIARSRAPVKSGALRDSIKVTSEPGKASYGSDLSYAQWVEFGTSNQPAQPFLRGTTDGIAG